MDQLKVKQIRIRPFHELSIYIKYEIETHTVPLTYLRKHVLNLFLGGTWYSDQDFESEFVEILNQQCHRFLEQKVGQL